MAGRPGQRPGVVTTYQMPEGVEHNPVDEVFGWFHGVTTYLMPEGVEHLDHVQGIEQEVRE